MPACLLAAIALIQTPETYLLRYNVPVGFRHEIKLKFHLELGPQGTISNESLIAFRVLSRTEKDYVSNTYFHTVDVKSTGEAKRMEAGMLEMRGMKVEMRRDFLGRALGAKVGDTEVGGGFLGGTSDLMYPSAPVAIGGSWTTSNVVSGLKVDTIYTLITADSTNGVPTYRIEGKLAEGAPIKTSTPIVYIVERSNGLPISGSGNYTITMNEFALKLAWNFERIPAPKAP